MSRTDASNTQARLKAPSASSKSVPPFGRGVFPTGTAATSALLDRLRRREQRARLVPGDPIADLRAPVLEERAHIGLVEIVLVLDREVGEACRSRASGPFRRSMPAVTVGG